MAYKNELNLTGDDVSQKTHFRFSQTVGTLKIFSAEFSLNYIAVLLLALKGSIEALAHY